MSEQVLLSEDDGILTVTLNRPEKLNAVNRVMGDRINEAVRSFGDREDLRVMVVAGTGRYFTAGLDISPDAMEDRRVAEGPYETRIAGRRRYRARFHLLLDEIEAIEKPVILAAQGPCIGLGVELAASCDFRFCTPNTHFGLPELKIGGLAGSGGISRVTRLVGPAWSKWMNMAVRNIDAELARNIGLVQEIHPPEELHERVMDFARSLAALPAEALGITKMAIDAVKAEDREKGRNIERLAVSALEGIPGLVMRMPE